MITTIATALLWAIANRKVLFKTILGLSVGLLLVWGITLHNKNKKLSESLEMALNNIEAYLGIVNDSLLANNVLMLDINDLKLSKDSLLLEIDETRKKLKIKENQLNTAATQKQILYVNDGKPTLSNLIEILKDTTYTDSIQYNDLTKVYYTIGADTVNVAIDLLNSQFLYIYYDKEYKNKKSFLKRLFTLDFKKVKKYKYEIENTNDLLKSEDVRVVELNNK